MTGAVRIGRMSAAAVAVGGQNGTVESAIDEAHGFFP